MNPVATNTLTLRDIHLPGQPDFWPPAPGWWLAAIMVIALLGWIGMKGLQYFRNRRRRKRILDLLEQLEQSSATRPLPDYLAQLTELMKRFALAHYPRRVVAPLSGSDWLHFLDESGGHGRFSQGPGRVLAHGPYMHDLPDSTDIAALTSLVRDWMKRNTVGQR
jgi:hypothetical protein